MGKTFFITGIDTDIGKTVATGLMGRFLRERGVDAITAKAVQTGHVGGMDAPSEDIAVHRKIMGLVPEFFEEDRLRLTCPERFSYPSSPYLAARLEGRVVDTDNIERCMAQCAAGHEVALVEGAGGIFVRLTEGMYTIDLIERNAWPAIIVAGARLGAINHTLLTIHAAASRGIKIAGVVFNRIGDPESELETDALCTARDALRALAIDAPVARMPEISDMGHFKGVDFSEIFG